MDFHLEWIDPFGMSEATLGLLRRALVEYERNGIREALQLARTARQIAAGLRARSDEGVSLIIVGAAWYTLGRYEHARWAFSQARLLLRTQASWHQRRNEALAFYGLGLSYLQLDDLVKAVVNFQRAVDTLKKVRFHYIVEGKDDTLDIVDTMAAELRGRIAAETALPVLDGAVVRPELTGGMG
jgi:tetratricopeptide (TPR) repeat protein